MQRRRHHAGQSALQRLLRRPLHTLAGKAARRCADLSVGHRAQWCANLEHRQAMRRRRKRLGWTTELEHRPRRQGPGQGAGLAHGLHVAGDKTAGKQRRLGGKAFGNDFGPDSGRIAHGDGQRLGEWRVHACGGAHAGLSTSMNW